MTKHITLAAYLAHKPLDTTVAGFLTEVDPIGWTGIGLS
jgi:hypothetical protein